jgi:hypothetical protein
MHYTHLSIIIINIFFTNIINIIMNDLCSGVIEQLQQLKQDTKEWIQFMSTLSVSTINNNNNSNQHEKCFSLQLIGDLPQIMRTGIRFPSIQALLLQRHAYRACSVAWMMQVVCTEHEVLLSVCDFLTLCSLWNDYQHYKMLIIFDFMSVILLS